MTNFWIVFISIAAIILIWGMFLLLNWICDKNEEAFKMTRLISKKIKQYDTKQTTN